MPSVELSAECGLASFSSSLPFEVLESTLSSLSTPGFISSNNFCCTKAEEDFKIIFPGITEAPREEVSIFFVAFNG